MQETHRHEKVLVFSQFADTVEYLTGELRRRGVQRKRGVTGDAPDPLRWRTASAR
jgi:ERCC4-related helicase